MEFLFVLLAIFIHSACVSPSRTAPDAACMGPDAPSEFPAGDAGPPDAARNDCRDICVANSAPNFLAAHEPCEFFATDAGAAMVRCHGHADCN